MPNPKIGLLGGSFNPAHAGHVYISKQALELLGLDEIWWLVSPQNPLKEKAGMAPFKERLKQAKAAAKPVKKIIVSDFESQANTTFTYDTLSALKAKYPDNNFVWLMGADNFLQFPKWHRWRKIMELVPIAVFNRDNLKVEILDSVIAAELPENKAKDKKQFALATPPAWVFLDIPTHPLSATQLRDVKLKGK